MVCHFCLDPSNYREYGSNITFCNQYCQIGYHVVNIGINPLEHKDIIFTLLLQVPPSNLYRLYAVSSKFRRVLRGDNSFKVAYVAKWEISDEFYLRAKYFEPMRDWLPYLDSYHGFLDRIGTMDEVFTAAIIQFRIDIVRLMLAMLPIGQEAISWSITYVINQDHYETLIYLIELFKYVPPSNQNLEDAVTQQADVAIIERILSTGAITDVENAIRWAGYHGNEVVMKMLLEYQETRENQKEGEGALKKTKTWK